jgi:flagellar biosynthesis protein FlhF
MKIRNYKGTSLEKIYQTIKNEMGPEAVVVNVKQPEGIRALMPGFIGGEAYEVIAVLDEAASERKALSEVAKTSDFTRLEQEQAERMRQIEDSLTEFREEIARMISKSHPSGTYFNPAAGDSPLVFINSWDQRFVKMVRLQQSEFFSATNRTEQVSYLENVIPVPPAFPLRRNNTPHVIALVGPTGSGKTTTIAKLAARWALDEKLKVGLITLDTFRVAAVDQLKEYATLLGVELKVALSSSEAAKAVQYFSDKDIILVDTAGRSPYDKGALTTLRGTLNVMGSTTVLLTIPATLDARNTAEMASQFALLKPNYSVLTKVDEALTIDAITAAIAETGCPIAFVTNGQRVPQDICEANAHEIADKLLPEECDCV